MQQVNQDDYKQTIKVPLYGTDTSAGGNLFGVGEGSYCLNMVPMKVKDLMTKESHIELHKRAPFTRLVSLSGKITGDLALCEPMGNFTTVLLNDINIAVMYDYDATHPSIRIISYTSTGTVVLIGSINNSNTTGGVDITATDQVFVTEIEHTSGGSIVPALAITWKKNNGSYSDGFYAISAGGVYTAASLTKISAASFPVTLGYIITGPFQQLNGIIYIMGVNGTIYGSGGSNGTINDITLWDSNNTILNRQVPDAGVGIFRYKHHIVAFNNSSVEFFNDAGNAVPGSALANTEQAFIRFGAYSPKQIINIDDTLFWMSSAGATQTIGIYKLDGYTPVKISTPAIDLTYSIPNSSQNGRMGVYVTNGKVNLVIDRQYDTPDIVNPSLWYASAAQSVTENAPENNPSDTADYYVDAELVPETLILCYNIQDDLWWRLSNAYNTAAFLPTGNISYSGNLHLSTVMFGEEDNTPANANSILKYYVYLVDQDSASGTSFLDSDGTSSSGADPYPCMVQTRNLDFGTSNNKRISRVDIIPRAIGKDTSHTNSAYLGVTLNPQDVDEDYNNPNFWIRHYITLYNPLIVQHANYNSTITGFNNVIRFSNIGMARSVQFMFYIYNSYGIVLKDMDVTFNMMTR